MYRPVVLLEEAPTVISRLHCCVLAVADRGPVSNDAEFWVCLLDSPTQNIYVLCKAVKAVLVQRVGKSDVVNVYRRNVTSNERVGKALVTHLWYVSLNLRLCTEMLARISLRGFLVQKKATGRGVREHGG